MKMVYKDPEKAREYWRNWRIKNRDKMKIYWKEYNLKNKIRISQQHKDWVNKNRDKINQRVKIHRFDLKLEILVRYSGNPPKCFCCNETLIEFLTIDHINGGGNQHREKINIKGGNTFYRWLKKNNYPEGYRIACLNCNFSLGHYGYCPHKKEIK
jgi:hypothetical protein